MHTEKYRWIKNRLNNNRRDFCIRGKSSPLAYPIRHREPQSGVAPQGLWIASSLSLLATTSFAKLSLREKSLEKIFALRSAFITLFALIIFGMIFAGQVSAGPVQYSTDKRFIDNGDATITDTKTGFMWMKEDSYQYKGHWLNWFEAEDYIEEINQERFADYLDWRLPTIKELTTLYEAEKLNSQQLGSEMKMHMDPIFAKEGSGTLWTSETNGNYNAFGVVFNHGQRFNSSKRKKARRAVRAIRLINP